MTLLRVASPLLFVLLLSACFGKKSLDLPPQDRNGQCYRTSDCLTGFTCEGATKEAPGTCQVVCQRDSDCGNNALCRSGQCQKDCAELGEKCSERRVCCFFDETGDAETDSHCLPDETGDVRCIISAAEAP